ncbi:hypothetical protein [Microcoleus vaginatus]|uniref:hypothetical protein n=1 Tax=Microcoleus vaginatus TaxID=119532 RepID=UPI0040407462
MRETHEFTKVDRTYLFYDPSIIGKCTVCDRTRNAVGKQSTLLKPLWSRHPASPRNTNMTFMNLISEFNELTLIEISLIMIVVNDFSVEII